MTLPALLMVPLPICVCAQAETQKSARTENQRRRRDGEKEFRVIFSTYWISVLPRNFCPRRLQQLYGRQSAQA